VTILKFRRTVPVGRPAVVRRGKFETVEKGREKQFNLVRTGGQNKGTIRLGEVGGKWSWLGRKAV